VLRIARKFPNVRKMSDDQPSDVQISNVVAPTGRDYELDEQLLIEDSHRLKALGDPLRLHICDLVLERAMSVTELSDLVDRPKGSVAYHVDLLVDAGLLQVVRTRKVRAVEERFYGRVARTFVYTGAAGEHDFLAQVAAERDHDRIAEMVASGTEIPYGEWGGSTLRHARIPHERVAEYVRRLDELALEFIDEPRGGDVEFGLYYTVYPTNRTTRKQS
jgi:DNA-binding transcriptional ArsR family regulator